MKAVRGYKEEYQALRESHEKRQAAKQFISLEEARSKKVPIDWENTVITQPSFLGTKVLDEIDLEDLVEYIDWTPFFSAWELKGKYPAIFEDEYVGEEAKRLFNDANNLLKEIVEKKLLTAKAVFGFFPANTVEDDDVEIYDFEYSDKENNDGNGSPTMLKTIKENRTKVQTKLHFLRQQGKKAPKLPNISLSDYIAPKDSGMADYIGCFVVTAGIGTDKLVEKFEKELDDYNSITTKALADRLAEALAEYLHERVRKEFWGYASSEELTNEELIHEQYRGIRPAPGYPACPDHLEKKTLFDMLDAEEHIGVSITESFAMAPAASVCGWYFAHPEAKYFGLGKITKDQVTDYAQRKGMTVKDIERWLSPNLSYDA